MCTVLYRISRPRRCYRILSCSFSNEPRRRVLIRVNRIPVREDTNRGEGRYRYNISRIKGKNTKLKMPVRKTVRTLAHFPGRRPRPTFGKFRSDPGKINRSSFSIISLSSCSYLLKVSLSYLSYLL